MKLFASALGLLLSLAAMSLSRVEGFNCTLPLTRVGEKHYFVESKDKLTWYDANERCIRSGLQLATVDSEYKFTELTDFLTSMGYRADWIWIGGFGRQGSWLQFGPARPLPYAKWYISQPDNLNSENCMNLYRIGEPWFMNDYSCRVKLSYICELDSTRVYIN
ncbi:C-type lectin 37Db-like [Drosophila pseudoobscura]|uniref:C-type lectin 37Db-like n=1 Tax=Drosophila pseudoobscura pseudoobscura TaxID=46245 RepID=A0A6I8UZ18_DROPS|nr:C-type lectin 37Db [Drosophila pseudoobscura]